MAHGQHIRQLYQKYVEGTLTPAELEALLDHFHAHGVPPEVDEQMMREIARPVADADAAAHRVAARVRRRISPRPQPRRLVRWLPYAAAAVLVALSVGLYFFAFHADRPQEIAATEILPGGNRATLTLVDGRTIDLSEAQQGIIVGNEITYADGTVISDNRQQTTDNNEPAGKENPGSNVSYLMSLKTPKGGTYQVTLPDGSKVWLNSASTLTYPSRFDGDERIVELVGEAYFDVRHETLEMRHETPDSALESHLKSHSSHLKSDGRPFRVLSKGQRVEVLGTQFNISAYPDEKETRTTLVEGSVKISHLTSHVSTLLKPGQQAINTGQQLTKEKVDLFTITAWQKGYFRFAENLESIMKQVARWYDVDVHFDNPSLKQESVLAYVKRNRPLSEILTILQESTGLNYTVQQRGQRKEVVVMR